MSRKKTQAEIDAQFEEEEQERHELATKRRDCCHWSCTPTEWHWATGTVRTLVCDDCGEQNDFEESP